MYLTILLILLIAACSNAEHMSALDSNNVVGLISDKSELERISTLANKNDEEAMQKMVSHLQASGRWPQAKLICDRGAELKYEKMLYCSSAYKFEEGGIKNCNIVITNFNLLEKIVHDEQVLRRYQILLGIDLQDGKAVCGDGW